MVYEQPRILPGEVDTQSSLGFWDTNGSFNLAQTTGPNDSPQHKKRTCWIVDFAVPTCYRVKLKDSKNRDNYLNLAWELKNYGLWRW